MKKIIIGILPQVKLNTNDNPYDDKYEFLDLYSKKIIENGAIPFGICLNHGELDFKSLEICDAFLLPGGSQVLPCYYQTIFYAIQSNKPLLGICLGLEAMAIYSCVSEYILKDFSLLHFQKVYKELKEKNEGTLLEKLESPNIHGDVIVNYHNIDEARHEVQIIDKSSLLHEIYKQEKINVVSLHSHNPKWVGKDFKITAKAEDGVLEAIEYNNKDYFILGVHFHPEWDFDNFLFKRLIQEGEKRKK